MKKMIVAVLMLAVAAVLHAGEGDVKTFRYKCVDMKGITLWESNITIAPAAGQGEDVYLMTEEIKGRYYGSDGITSRRREMRYIENKEQLTPLSMDEKVFSESGNLIRESTQRFYPDKKRVECTVKDLAGGKEKKESLRYDGDIINGMIMDDYIERFLAAGEKKRAVYLLEGAELYRMTLRIVATEQVTVNGKTREAYKIALDPEIGLFNPVKIFITKNHEWYSTEPPYEWIKFQGLESSLDSPIVEMFPVGD